MQSRASTRPTRRPSGKSLRRCGTAASWGTTRWATRSSSRSFATWGRRCCSRRRRRSTPS
eukprot:7277046-Prymnesium_polylepis.1